MRPFGIIRLSGAPGATAHLVQQCRGFGGKWRAEGRGCNPVGIDDDVRSDRIHAVFDRMNPVTANGAAGWQG